jgi:hypothetical protein
MFGNTLGGRAETCILTWSSRVSRALMHHGLTVNLLADERALGDGLQGSDPPAHLGSPVELQPYPRGGEGVTLSVGHLGGPQGRGGGGEAGCRGARLT